VSDKIVSPKTHKKIGKYESAWWQLIRQGWHEDVLESQPIVEKQPVYIKSVKHINQNHLSTISRAGVIMVTDIQHYRLFGLGLDKTYQQLTDFAGGVKKLESAISAALREFNEETYGLFYQIPIANIGDAKAIYDKHNLIIFLHIHIDIDDLNIQFHELKRRHQGKIEMDDIVWMTDDQLKLAIKYKYKYIYARLCNFLDKAGNFMDYL